MSSDILFIHFLSLHKRSFLYKNSKHVYGVIIRVDNGVHFRTPEKVKKEYCAIAKSEMCGRVQFSTALIKNALFWGRVSFFCLSLVTP